MTDPVFRNRCSFFKHALGPKRVRPVPFTVAQLPPIDLIILSHNHTDHLDRTALCDIAKLNPNVKFYVPLRMKKWLVKNVKNTTPEQFIDMDWWQEIEHVPFEKHNIVSTNNRLPTHVSGSLKVTFLPSQHWSVRNTINDWNHQLWGGFGLCYTPHLMTQQSRTIYFAGDTGYNNTMFKKIYERFAEPNGGIDVAFIPIGAYGPRWFSASQHADPMEAVQIAVDIGAKHSCGMHWGTFLVSTEPVLEPVEKLHQALQLMQLDYHQQPNEKESNGDDFFITVAHGQTKTCTHKPKKSHVDVLHGKDKDQNTSVILQMEKEK
jgi:N-acyl-phosphatidylethanolamine-hydrolysing phospholipase D